MFFRQFEGAFMKLLALIVWGFSFSALAQTQLDQEVSILALKEILAQNPFVEPADERDEKQKFTDLISEYINPGLYTVFDEKTGAATTHVSHTTNACVLFEGNATASTYNCRFEAGYAKSVAVDEFNNITIDMGLLLSTGILVRYDFKINADSSKKILSTAYYSF